MPHAHSFSGLNIFTERSEYQAGPRPDECYAIALSCIDTDSEDEYADTGSRPGEPGGAPAAGAAEPEQLGCPVLYEGDPITVTKGEGVWIPVVVGPSPLQTSESGAMACAFLAGTAQWRQYPASGTGVGL